MQVLEACHAAELGGGHFGCDKTLAKISERFFWLGMVDDVKEFCRTCDACQRANKLVQNARIQKILFCAFLLFYIYRKFDKAQAELHPVPVEAKVWHTVGPLPEIPRGNKYIMTVSGLFPMA